MKLSTIIVATCAVAVAEAAHIQIAINPSTLVPSPSTQISHSTSAYLTKSGQTYAAPLSADGSFDFRNVSSGSYLVDIVSAEYLFAPLRLDILETAAGEEVKAWGTWRGNEWGNNGEIYQVKSIGEQPGREGVKRIEVSVAAKKEVFVDRVGCKYPYLRSSALLAELSEHKLTDSSFDGHNPQKSYDADGRRRRIDDVRHAVSDR